MSSSENLMYNTVMSRDSVEKNKNYGCWSWYVRPGVGCDSLLILGTNLLRSDYSDHEQMNDYMRGIGMRTTERIRKREIIFLKNKTLPGKLQTQCFLSC